MIRDIQQGLQDEGYRVSISQLCRWFNVPRRTVYYRPTHQPPKMQERFSVPIKQLIEEHPSFGYRTVAYLLGFNKNTVQRVFQLMRWQVRTRPVGFLPRVRALPSVASRWATDLCRVWSGRDGLGHIGTGNGLPQPVAAGLAPLAQWEIEGRGVGSGASTDHKVWHSWASPEALFASLGQRPSLHLEKLHRPRARL